LQASMVVSILYAIGVLACVFHLANGIWTFGITWGIWVTPAAQRWATAVCLVFGLGLAAVGLGALGGFTWGVNVEEARRVEDEMYEKQFAVEIEEAKKHDQSDPNAKKRYDPKEQLRGHSPATASVLNPEP